MKKTELDFDFTVHRADLQEKIYKEIHSLTYQEQIEYYQSLIVQSSLGKFWQSLQEQNNQI
ncbi:MAG: hypothetical protein J7647_29410 [Cyanobacteria bacterium SBLK]|nr:hypothetical protein [Cyanobacteria bacterium SBLK]